MHKTILKKKIIKQLFQITLIIKKQIHPLNKERLTNKKTFKNKILIRPKYHKNNPQMIQIL